jgi:hypothetical protein
MDWQGINAIPVERTRTHLLPNLLSVLLDQPRDRGPIPRGYRAVQ